MTQGVLREGRGYRVRRAGPADSAALCALVRRVHMAGAELDVTQERDPDFFRILELHDGELEVWLAETDGGTVGGSGSVVVRPGWLDGEVRPVGYLTDLRLAPGHRAARAMPGCYREILERARDRYGVEVFTTVIFDDNQRARSALLHREGRRRQLPIYRPMTPFDMVSAQLVLPSPPPRREVRSARPGDLDALSAFLAGQARLRPLADPLSRERLERRFERWPGLKLSDFLIATGDGGRIAGCCAPWDPEPGGKRTRVHAYGPSTVWLVRAARGLAALTRRAAPPKPGESFRFAFLSHLEVEGDDPEVFSDLLRAAERHLRGRGLHFMSALVPRGSPLARAFRGFMTTRTPMTLYSVVLPDGPHAERSFATSRPGFEIALS